MIWDSPVSSMSSYVNDINLYAAASLEELIDSCPVNDVIGDNLVKAWSKINHPYYKKILCTISGGSDSDVLLDICIRCDKSLKVEYVWFDTGLEYQAIKDHLVYLEKKYNITIKRVRAIKPIPTSCKEYGQPFMNKRVSEYMMRLQKFNFEWEDEDFLTLVNKYCKKASMEDSIKFDKVYADTGKMPKGWVLIEGDWYRGCISALKWWCNENYKGSQCNIENNKWLKEFIIANHPPFKVANICCKFAKKDVSKQLMAEGDYDLCITGVRKAEGGMRAQAYHGCFDNGEHYDNYRPIFWYKDADKKCYVKNYNIVNSRCYSEYGLCRTGCVGCPCARDTKKELKIVETYEPKLYKAVTNVFKDSYEYEARYRDFQAMMK